MMLHAIVFDFDGVLADSEPLHFEVFRQVLGHEGITLDENTYYDRYLGYADYGAFRQVLLDNGQPAAEEAIQALIETKIKLFPEFVNGKNVLFPGVAERVRAFAAERPLAIASGAFPHEIELILNGARLRDAFQVLVGAGDTPHSKPAPDPYARAVELLQAQGLVPPGAGGVAGCVAIEDSKWGIQSAKAAGLPCVAVTTSYPASELTDADRIVSSVTALTLADLEALAGQPR